MNNKPIPESYWVVPDAFLAGAYPVSRLDETSARLCLEAFLESGFNAFFDLTRVGELPSYLLDLQEAASRYGVSIHYQRFNIQDRGLPAHEQMTALLDALDAALVAGCKVYLHCWGGIGRTGMTVGCWLVRHGMTGEQALIHLNELYQMSGQSRLVPMAPETDAQVKYILDWIEDGLA